MDRVALHARACSLGWSRPPQRKRWWYARTAMTAPISSWLIAVRGLVVVDIDMTAVRSRSIGEPMLTA